MIRYLCQKESKRIKKNIFQLILATLAIAILFKFFFLQSTTKKLEATCDQKQQCSDISKVVVLHGLVRSSNSMNKVSQALSNSGYEVCNVQYPSRKHSVAKLAQDLVYPAIKQCFEIDEPLNFVTHSMGGIVVRQLAISTDLEIGRAVMLSPPNNGSELVDKLKIIPFFKLINGEAGLSLGTESNSVPNSLGKVTFETGIIVGNKSLNPIYSALIPGEDDGKVSIESAKVAGMKDFLVVPYSHSFIMNKDDVIQQAISFLKHGQLVMS